MTLRLVSKVCLIRGSIALLKLMTLGNGGLLVVSWVMRPVWTLVPMSCGEHLAVCRVLTACGRLVGILGAWGLAVADTY